MTDREPQTTQEDSVVRLRMARKQLDPSAEEVIGAIEQGAEELIELRAMLRGPCVAERIDAGAILLWHRFASAYIQEWEDEDETNKTEYRDAAKSVLALWSVT